MTLKVAAFGSDRSGVSYYRVKKPTWEAARQGLIEADSVNPIYVLEPVTPRPNASPHQLRRYRRNDEKYEQLGNWADVMTTIRYIQFEQGALLHILAWKFGVPWILDVDDDVFNLNIDNPMHETYRKREPHEVFDARLVEDGDTEVPGEMLYTNKHGDNVAVKIKDQDAYTICKHQIEDADALTVSTPVLRDLYYETRKAAGKTNEIYVLPNSICLRDWDACPPGPDHYPEVWVGWQGGSSHTSDLDLIADVIDGLMYKHSNMRFLWVNIPHKGLFELVKKYPGRVTFLEGWMEIGRYHDYYAAMNFDIALAPLVNNQFNRGKSSLKWMEACARSQVCVCSDVGPYKAQVRNWKDGVLVKNTPRDWYEALDKLIRQRSLREDIGKRGRRRVEKDFCLEKNVKIRAQVYQEVYDKFGDMASDRAHLLEPKPEGAAV
jgi:glycosyltransferase involved in cell wall biosynthesis